MTKSKQNFSFRKFINGQILTEKIFINQWKLFLLIFCLILVFISNRYYCSKKLSEMNRLNNELIDLRHEQVILTTRLTAISRQAQIEEMLHEKGVDLKKGNTVIYHIQK